MIIKFIEMKKLLFLFMLLPMLGFGQAYVAQSKTPATGANAGNQYYQYYGLNANGYLIIPTFTNATANRSTPINGQFGFQTSDSTGRVYWNGTWLPLGGGGSSSAYYSSQYFYGLATYENPLKVKNSDSLAHQGLSYFQPTLVSGTNIKTLNGTSLLGSGNIVVSGNNIYNSDGKLTAPRTLSGGASFNSLILDSLGLFQTNVTTSDGLGTGSMYLRLNGTSGNLAFSYGNGDQYNMASDDGGGFGPTEFLIGGGNASGNFATLNWFPAVGGISVRDNSGYGLTAGYGVDTTKMGTSAYTYVTSGWVLGRLHALSGGGVTSFNTRTGAVTLSSSDVTTALTFTPYNATNPSNYIARTGISATSPVLYNNSTGVVSIQQASGSQPGYLSSTDWTTFNGKQAALSGTGFVKISGTTISYDNSTYLTTAVAASTYVSLSGSYSNPSWLTGVPYSILTGTVPTWNQNTTGTAANITATSNSTITTLSALSLPYSQITGTPSVPTASNPTATVGTTAVNGSATTYMRSDAAPAINQGITPTWTSNHTFQLNSLGSTIALSNAAVLAVNNTSATSGNQQYSPLIGVQGNFYNTTAFASQPIAMLFGLTPIQGTAGTANLVLYTSVNGGTPTASGFQVSQGGAVLGGTFSATAGGIGSTSSDGISITNATAATGSLAQWSRRFRQSGFYWNGSASTQAEVTQELQTTTSSGATWVLSGRTGGSGSFNPYFGVSMLNGLWSLNGTNGTANQIPQVNSGATGMQWVAGTISGISLGSNLATETYSTGLISGSYNGGTAATVKADTTVLQTVLNFFPKGDTRYYKASNPIGYITNSVTTLPSLSLPYSQLTGTPSLSAYLTASNFITSETPSGSINGSNTSFTAANSPVTGTIKMFWNGVRTTKFTATGASITTLFVANTGDTILIDYQK